MDQFKVTNLLKLELAGEAFGDSVDEVGEGEGSSAVPVRGNIIIRGSAAVQSPLAHCEIDDVMKVRMISPQPVLTE